MKKLLSLLLVAGLLCGCSSQGNQGQSESNGNQEQSDKATQLYDGLDAKATYEKAIDYFNECTYFQYNNEYWNIFKDVETGKQRFKYKDLQKGEYYYEGEKFDGPRFLLEDREYYDDNNQHSLSLNVNIFKDDQYFDLRSTSDRIEYGFYYDEEGNSYKANNYPESVQKELYNRYQFGHYYNNLYDNKNCEILDIQRIDQDGGIKLALKYKVKNTDTETVYDENYIVSDYTINKDGYITEESGKSYEDSKQKNLNGEWIYKYSHFNEKDDFNYDEEVNKHKAYVGKSEKEYINYLKFDKPTLFEDIR